MHIQSLERERESTALNYYMLTMRYLHMFEDLDLKVTDEKIVVPGTTPDIVMTRKIVCGTATCTGKYCC